jgi:hypothetical protein
MDQNNQYARTVQWAMQLPDPTEPRTNGVSGAFMNSFLRGNRDTNLRSFDASILQALNLMNNGFVTNKIQQNFCLSLPNQPCIRSTVQRLLADPNLTNEQIVTQLFLHTLSRYPTEVEKTKLLAYFGPMGKTQATESVQWALLNKSDFIFNY